MKARHLWLDLETGGLDPERVPVIEVAATTTSIDLVELSKFHRNVGHDIDSLPMTRWAWKQHTESGLLDEVAVAYHDGETLEEVDKALQKFIVENTVDEPLRLAGSSVHFDRSFMAKYLPLSLSKLHYRQFDVSAFYEIGQWIGVDFPKQVKAHRAMGDVQNSLAAARFFRERLVK